MSRLDALTSLRDNVQDEGILHSVDAVDAFPMTPDGDVAWLHACKASQGSLDAAKALHEAVLPGWEWGVTCNKEQPEGPAAFVAEWGDYENGFEATADDPARAWLLAVLEALIAQEGAKG